MGKKNKNISLSKLADERIGRYINKCIDFAFDGIKLKLYLSHALFSSYDIDDGSKLLLKTIARNIDFAGIEDVLDVGCGIGVLGLALKKRHPELNVRLTDRDALALAFTRENGNLNALSNLKIEAALGIGDLSNKYDLIVSNIPAKMGNPAMNDMVARAIASLNKNGTAAFVVIFAFKQVVEQAILQAHGTIVFREETDKYSVFHCRGTSAGNDNMVGDFPACYFRGRHDFVFGTTVYSMATAFNLPDFDTIGYQCIPALSFLEKNTARGRVLLINPGQGHIACYLLASQKDRMSRIALAGRDLLQLYTARHNLVGSGFEPGKVTLVHSAFTDDIKDRFDLVVVFPEVVPGVAWETELLSGLASVTGKGSRIIIAAKSVYIHRLLQSNTAFSVIRKTKDKGFSGVLLENR